MSSTRWRSARPAPVNLPRLEEPTSVTAVTTLHPSSTTLPAAVMAELATDAARLEREGVTGADVQRLAAAGLLALYGPPELGGASAAEQRRVAEQLAGASPDAWFVWYQHGPVVRMLAASDNEQSKQRHLAALCSGRELGAVSYSHLRTPRPSTFAERVEGGWRLTGSQPWCTAWPLADVVLAGALDRAADRVVFALVPAGDRPELHSTGLLNLAAMGGTSTHALAYEGLAVGDAQVLAVRDRAEFQAQDTGANTNVQSSTFGVALAALDLLEQRQPAAAARLRERVLEVRTRAYRLIDEVPAQERHDERLAARAQALVLGVECATALLTARGGQGMDLADPAQRLLRAAAFQIVHSQAAHIRAATLDLLVA